MLTGRDRLLEIASAGLDVAGAEAAELLIVRDASGLTRFASNRIHQNVWREDGELRARVVLSGGRCGIASSHDLSPVGALETAARARAVAEVSVADPEFAGLSWPAPYPRVDSFSEETAGADPQARAEAVKQALAGLPGGWEGAGAYETGGVEMALANSNGVRAYHPSSRCAFSILVSGRDSSGWAETTEFDRSRVDTAASAARAARKAEISRHPIEIPAGTYPVVLEPCAVGALVQFLGYMGLGAKAYLEGRSFASGRLGRQVTHEKVTIVDDALRAENLGVPFDFEGVPKQRVALIDHGVLSGVVWDLATARKAGRASTGHGLPAPNVDGPSAMHLEMEPGAASPEDLVAGLERGLLVTRFHYTNVVNPMDTSITGMTRDGTFLVENGKIVAGVKNLRFTQSVLAALAAVEEVGRDTEVTGELFFGYSRTPGLRISAFHFSSTTTF